MPGAQRSARVSRGLETVSVTSCLLFSQTLQTYSRLPVAEHDQDYARARHPHSSPFTRSTAPRRQWPSGAHDKAIALGEGIPKLPCRLQRLALDCGASLAAVAVLTQQAAATLALRCSRARAITYSNSASMRSTMARSPLPVNDAKCSRRDVSKSTAVGLTRLASHALGTLPLMSMSFGRGDLIIACRMEHPSACPVQ